MCRYLDMSPRKMHYACLECHQSWQNKEICPSCSKAMTRMGYDFKPPGRTQLNQWKKLELLCRYLANPFNSCGCCGPGYRPKTFGEMKRWIANKYLNEKPKRHRHLKKLLDKKPVITVKLDS